MSGFSTDLVEGYEKFVVPTYRRELLLMRGEGSRVWDGDGKAYLDMGGGIAVNCLGHAHPRIVKVLHEQAMKLTHVSNLYYNEHQGELARELVRLTGSGKVFFSNSGAEANECLYKLARKWGEDQGRYEVITALGSFHGRTLGGISATGQEKIKAGFRPEVPGFKHAKFNDLGTFEQVISDQTAAVLVEGIQGESGILPADADFLIGLRKLTEERGILLFIDGIQCGCFRTGRWQSYESILSKSEMDGEFLPDGIAMAKSIGNGFPIGATWISEKYANVLQPGMHGTTYGGTPLACAVVREVLAEIQENNLQQNVVERGEHLKAGLSELKGVVSVRGMGALLGCEVEGDGLKVVKELAHAGLLVIPAGGNVIRFLPAFNIGEVEVEEALSICQRVMGKA